MARRNPAETPLMRQYLQVKESHPDAILFFRMGDFYEMFFEDAVIAARVLDLTLTSRDKGREDAIPMAGVPHHAARGYVARLTEQGHKVVICEQVEDPKQAKGLVKREVVQIVTPGVVIDDEVLSPKEARYVAAVTTARGRFGLGLLDASTGEFRATEVDGIEALVAELSRTGPREILVSRADGKKSSFRVLRARATGIAYTDIDELSAKDVALHLSSVLPSLDKKELGIWPLAARAAAHAFEYARATQPTGSLPITRLQFYRSDESVVLDDTAVANLELTQTLIGARREGSLLSVIDATRTAPGGRLLRRWLLYPLVSVAPIRRRQDAVEYLIESAGARDEVREALKGVYDLERLAGRISLGVASPRDLGQLRRTLEALPTVCEGLRSGAGKKALLPELLVASSELHAELAQLAARLASALVDDPPLVLKDGGVIRDGFCDLVDEQRGLAQGGKSAIAAIETRERERTGISSLRVKYNRVFGYYIEVTRSQLSRVPDEYVRKQTIATAERFVTPELAELESKILAAQDALIGRETELFRELVGEAREAVTTMLEVAAWLSSVDCCAALAEVAHMSGYVRPEVTDDLVLDIVGGRHPVVETTVESGTFVPNDCRLDPDAEQISVITGPNMAGKSTFMRQVAQIVLLAQMGSYVPAEVARIGLVDRIYTRVGAADNLARGESTFMVEMRETSAILKGATRRSLVVLDEVGRGTSTFDGVSIAWAVTEYLHDSIGARTLFATHYHELTALADTRPRVRNLSVAVREHDGEIVFLRQVIPGAANRSYGIDVARLAGLPRSVVARARSILGELERGQLCGETSQLSLFAAQRSTEPAAASEPEEHPLLERLRALDLDNTTPMQALALLGDLRGEAREGR